MSQCIGTKVGRTTAVWMGTITDVRICPGHR
jgi:hypothetical protein